MWKLKHKKEKTMENYEVKGVSNASEIRDIYKYAKDNNVKYYRAVSKTNQIYGWNENTNNFVKAQAGQEWFENPHYQAPSVEEPIEEKAEILEELEEVANEMVEEVKAEEVVAENATTEEIDYKALYEEKCAELEEVKMEKQKALDAVEYYKQENEELKDGLFAFKTLLNKF